MRTVAAVLVLSLCLTACCGPAPIGPRQAATAPASSRLATPSAAVVRPTASPAPGSSLRLTLAPGVEPELVCVPAGEFTMGSADGDGLADDDEKPRHTVYLDEYCIGKTEVTVGQFRAFVQATGYRTTAEVEGNAMGWREQDDGSKLWDDLEGADWQHPQGPGSGAREDHPVTQVSWDDAVAFCQWLSWKAGRTVRLPTEAEWEKAARGTDARSYPWGDLSPTGDLLNWDDEGRYDTTPVGTYPAGASPYGALDMAGNAAEWTSSLYRPYPYLVDDGREDPKSRDTRVFRGNAVIVHDGSVRAANRDGGGPDVRAVIVGFRVCVSPM